MDVLGVVRRLFSFAFDAVLPPRERSLRTKVRTIQDAQFALAVQELLGERITAIANYRDAAIQDLVRALECAAAPPRAYGVTASLVGLARA